MPATFNPRSGDLGRADKVYDSEVIFNSVVHGLINFLSELNNEFPNKYFKVPFEVTFTPDFYNLEKLFPPNVSFYRANGTVLFRIQNKDSTWSKNLICYLISGNFNKTHLY